MGRQAHKNKTTRDKNRTGRKLRCPEVTGVVECVDIKVPLLILPFIRIWFDQMKQKGLWEREEDWLRARDIFSQVEAMAFSCSEVEEIKENTNLNFCTLVAFLMPLLTEGLINPTLAMYTCNIIRDGLKSPEGSIDWIAAISSIVNLEDIGVGLNTNQLEPYNKTLTELIGGAGILPPVD
jgi:hypothetical protein